MKKYRLKHDAHATEGLPWVVNQWYPYNKAEKRFGRWCVIAKFYRRGDARLFIRELKVDLDQRPVQHYSKPNW